MSSTFSAIYNFMIRKAGYQISFWFAILLGLTMGQYIFYKDNFWFFFTNELINVLFYMAIVYFNFSVLIPKYLSRNQYSAYTMMLVLVALVVTPIKLAIFNIKFMGMADQQEYIRSHQIYHYIISFVVGAASAGVRITGDWLTNQQDKKELEHRTIQSELNFLKSQINPHFLFNTLNSLYALTLRKSDNAPEIVLKLSEMMRYMLYECNEKRVPLSKEVNYLRNYLDLELLRHGNGIDVQFDINGEISDQQIAPLLFIPFLENCFKHGLKNRISKGFVKIRLDVTRQNVLWHIENSKPEAIPMKDSRPSGGIGLVNVRRRLDILYAGHYTLSINDKPNTYEVDLQIDLTY